MINRPPYVPAHAERLAKIRYCATLACAHMAVSIGLIASEAQSWLLRLMLFAQVGCWIVIGAAVLTRAPREASNG